MNLSERRRFLWWHYPPGILLLLILIAAFLLWLQGTTTGWIEIGNRQPAEIFGETVFDGRLFSFTHSTAFTITRHEPDPAGLFQERVLISAAKPYSRQVAASVRNLPDDGLAGVADVYKRRGEPEIYVEDAATLAGRSAIRFTRTGGGYEVALFIVRDGTSFATFSISTPDSGAAERVASEFATLTASFVLR